MTWGIAVLKRSKTLIVVAVSLFSLMASNSHMRSMVLSNHLNLLGASTGIQSKTIQKALKNAHQTQTALEKVSAVGW